MSKRHTPPAFKGYWIELSPKEKTILATKSGVSKSHLSQLAHGIRRADVNTLKKICNSDSRITARMLRPDLPE